MKTINNLVSLRGLIVWIILFVVRLHVFFSGTLGEVFFFVHVADFQFTDISCEELFACFDISNCSNTIISVVHDADLAVWSWMLSMVQWFEITRRGIDETRLAMEVHDEQLVCVPVSQHSHRVHIIKAQGATSDTYTCN